MRRLSQEIETYPFATAPTSLSIEEGVMRSPHLDLSDKHLRALFSAQYPLLSFGASGPFQR